LLSETLRFSPPVRFVFKVHPTTVILKLFGPLV
jgi:hypothetical protein